jgi:hypothetical protein
MHRSQELGKSINGMEIRVYLMLLYHCQLMSCFQGTKGQTATYAASLPHPLHDFVPIAILREYYM